MLADDPGLGFTPTEWRSDLALVTRTLDGDPAAEEEFAKRLGCVRLHLAWLNGKAGGPFRTNELDDLVQDVQVVVLQKLASFAGRSKLETWVQKFCYLHFKHALHASALSKSRLVDLQSFEETIALDPARPEAELERYYRVLSPMQRRVFYLHVVIDMDLSEIAEELGQSRPAVKTHWLRTKDKLRALLEQEGIP